MLISNRKLSRKRFLAWLERRPPDECVGRTQENLECPIATYCAKEVGLENVDVGSEAISYDGRLDGYPIIIERDLPRWARCFVKKADDLGEDVPVAAARALELLRGC